MSSRTWCIVGSSRGIGLEFVRQILAKGDQVIAAVRDPKSASEVWQLAANSSRPGACEIHECDVRSEQSIDAFAARLKQVLRHGIDYLVLNAGVLNYPNRATEISYSSFAHHLHTNTIGPIITAQRLLATGLPIGTIVFMSSDSGSALNFHEFEDGFGAYAASKAALNQMLRHMAAELRRRSSPTVILAMHPGEVSNSKSDIEPSYDIEGVLTPQESVEGMLHVIPTKTLEHSGTFWTWEGREHPW